MESNVSKAASETINSDVKIEVPTNVDSKIVKQLEFYFSDTNLPYDKFLQNEIKNDDGWVKIEVLLTFKRLASISKDPLVIASAVKNAIDTILEVNESNEKIRRKLDNAIPVANQEFINEMIERSIYCKGFPKTATMDELLEFAATFGDKVITKVTTRKIKNTKDFKGSLYFTFSTKEQADDFLKRESVKYNDVELERRWERDFLENKKKEYESKLAIKDQKMISETEKYFKKGYLLKASAIENVLTVDGIKTVCFRFEWPVAFVKLANDDKIAWIRLKPVKAAKELLEETTLENDLKINFSIPDEETEQTVLNEMTKEFKVILQMKDKLKRERNKNKGVKRYKRRNDDSNINKKIKMNDN